jgi:hypothetical protein
LRAIEKSWTVLLDGYSYIRKKVIPYPGKSNRRLRSVLC